ncbi:hypothetical protein [Streptomyces sp. NPDC058614]|uniref:hypothetical protein n=1 Tax=Streptomyces sp. NPDC058614 TaxID=3346557 RepID=UPI003649A444
MVSRVSSAFRLWSGVLLACALLLCLVGVARPAVAMPSGMESMPASAMDCESGVAESMTVGPAAAEGVCPMGRDHCAQLSATLPAAAAAVPALAEVAPVILPDLLRAPRTGLPPQCGPDPPPDLHRLCVSRT